MTPKLFSELALSPELLKAIAKLGFEQAAPIQAAAIPVLMSGKDVVGQSQTGSGKTAAFAIPAIEKTDPQLRAVQVLILCPTRELAVQVCEEVHKLAFFKRGISALPIYGGQSYDRQLLGLRQGAQIIIGTPGRVMDHMNRGTLRLDQLKMVILDEADVMLNMGFREDIEFILQTTPTTRQTIFFSATMPRPIRELIERHSKTPENVRVDQQAMTVPTVEQIYFEVDRRWKIEVLTRLIDVHDLKLCIIFCNTKRMVDELVEHLNTQGYSAEGLHGDMNQAQRDRVMNKFRKSGLEFLVATDVAARGIDVDDIEAVFNYDLPYDVEDYVHRIGRTGRAGRSGMAFSFVAGRELFQIRNIERFTKMRIQRGRVPSVAEVDEARADVLIGKVRATLQGGDFARHDHAVERLLEEGFDSTDIISAVLHLLQGGEPGTPPREEKSDPRKIPASPARTMPVPGSAPLPATSNKIPAAAHKAPTAQKQLSTPPLPTGEPQTDRKSASSGADSASSQDDSAPSQAVPGTKPSSADAGSASAHPAKRSEQAAPANYQTDSSSNQADSSSEHAESPYQQTDLSYNQPESASYKTDLSCNQAEASEKHPESDKYKTDLSSNQAAATSAHAPTSSSHPPEHPSQAPPASPQPGFPPRKPGIPKKEVRGAYDRPATRQPVRRDYDQYEDQPYDRPRHDDSGPAPAPRRPASRRTPAEMTRLWMSVGEAHGVAPGDVVGCILGETGLPSGTVGVVDIRERHTFVDVAAESANGIIAKLNRTKIRGQRLKVKLA